MDTTKNRILILALLFCASLFFRVWGLGDVGLSEDEANKILAIDRYRHGDFSPNAEHPMLMKLLCGGSVIIAEESNRLFHTSISPEAALRFPVAVAGSLITPAIYGLGLELLNPTAAIVAAALWTTDINAVALTRIAKEDPLATLFFVTGMMFLLRAKRFHFENPRRATRNYIACGASFGLLFASKYLVPILWLPLIYYDIFRFGKEPKWRISSSDWKKIHLAFFGVLLLCNPILLSPPTWSYVWDHFNHRRLTHNGYFMMDHITLNKAYYTLWGTPPYFFPLYLFAKTPLPLLLLLAIGLFYALRRYRDERFLFLGFYFVVWLFLLSLSGGKFTRYVVTLLPAVILLQSLAITMMYVALKAHFQKRQAGAWIPHASLALLLLCTAGWYAALDVMYKPYHSLYVAAQAGGTARRGYYFPQDDFYDAGLREGIAGICRDAPKGAQVLGATPAVFSYYQGRFGRTDLEFHSTAEMDLPLRPDLKPYILYQEYRTYLENYYLQVFFRSALLPLNTIYVQGLPSVVVYRLCADRTCARIPFWKADHWPDHLAVLNKDHHQD